MPAHWPQLATVVLHNRTPPKRCGSRASKTPHEPPAVLPRPCHRVKHSSKQRVDSCPSRPSRAVSHLTCWPLPLPMRAMAANSPKSLQATEVLESCRSGAERVVGDFDDGTAKLAEPLPLPLSRCRLPLALKAAHATLVGSCGMLRATEAIRYHCRLPPCRLACQRSSSECRRCTCRLCRRSIDIASPCLVPRWQIQRATAAWP